MFFLLLLNAELIIYFMQDQQTYDEDNDIGGEFGHDSNAWQEFFENRTETESISQQRPTTPKKRTQITQPSTPIKQQRTLPKNQSRNNLFNNEDYINLKNNEDYINLQHKYEESDKYEESEKSEMEVNNNQKINDKDNDQEINEENQGINNKDKEVDFGYDEGSWGNFNNRNVRRPKSATDNKNYNQLDYDFGFKENIIHQDKEQLQKETILYKGVPVPQSEQNDRKFKNQNKFIDIEDVPYEVYDDNNGNPYEIVLSSATLNPLTEKQIRQRETPDRIAPYISEYGPHFQQARETNFIEVIKYIKQQQTTRELERKAIDKLKNIFNIIYDNRKLDGKQLAYQIIGRSKNDFFYSQEEVNSFVENEECNEKLREMVKAVYNKTKEITSGTYNDPYNYRTRLIVSLGKLPDIIEDFQKRKDIKSIADELSTTYKFFLSKEELIEKYKNNSLKDNKQQKLNPINEIEYLYDKTIKKFPIIGKLNKKIVNDVLKDHIDDIENDKKDEKQIIENVAKNIFAKTNNPSLYWKVVQQQRQQRMKKHKLKPLGEQGWNKLSNIKPITAINHNFGIGKK